MPKHLKITPEKCIGCKSCEIACSLENEGEMNPSKSRIKMLAFIEGKYRLPYNLVMTCKQCADAPCLVSCPVKAISRSKDSMKTVVIDMEACIGCGECVGACPFGVMLFNKETKKPYKCELCGGQPACVAVCPTGAIVFVDQRPFYAQAQALQMEGFLISLDRNRQNVRDARKHG